MTRPEDGIVAKIDKARQLLAEARDAKGAKLVADIARAAEIYARRQKLSQEAIDYATTIRIDAMTMMGEMLKETEKQAGARGTGSNQHRKVESRNGTPPTLKEVGIGKRESSDAQALADIKKTDPELHEKVRTGKATVSKARVEVKRQKKRNELDAKVKVAKKSPANWRIELGDCRAWHLELGENPRLIFADPPYNIGVDYGEGAKADKLSDKEYLAFCSEWINLCEVRLAKDGSMWVLIGDEYAAEIACLLRDHGFHRRAWIKWYETFGVNQANNFNRTSRHLFYCVKDPKNFVFHPEAVNRPSDRQTKYGDSRADPGGKIWDDVWQIPRLVGTAEERIPDFPTQLPLALLRPIIACSSDPGDLVFDPFCGSGTTGVAAIELGRQFVGIEKSKKFRDLAQKRLVTI